MNNTLSLNPPFVFKGLFSIAWKNIFRIFLIFSIILTSVFLILYVFQTNREVSERYLIKEYEEKLDLVLERNQNLEINLVKANSLDNVIALMSELNFEEINKIHYIQVIDNQVVSK